MIEPILSHHSTGGHKMREIAPRNMPGQVSSSYLLPPICYYRITPGLVVEILHFSLWNVRGNLALLELPHVVLLLVLEFLTSSSC